MKKPSFEGIEKSVDIRNTFISNTFWEKLELYIKLIKKYTYI